MLCSTQELDGVELGASDGSMGAVREIFFDDRDWVVRHLVVDTGGWLSGRSVLISPHAIAGFDRDARVVQVRLTRAQVEAAPGMETDMPLSRQREAVLYDYYGYPYYWGGGGLWGTMDVPMGGGLMGPVTLPPPAFAAADRSATGRPEATGSEGEDAHLRSSAQVIGYDVEARDGDIGHINDFLFDELTWQIRWVVVDTHNWLPDRLVLVSPSAVEKIDWEGRRAVFRVTRAAVEASPPYIRGAALTDEHVRHVQRHFESSE